MQKKYWIVTIVAFLTLLSITTMLASSNEEHQQDIAEESSSSTLLSSHLFTQEDNLSTYTQEAFDMSDFEAVLENDLLILYVNEDNLAIRIENKNTGHVFASDLLEIEDNTFNPQWERKSESPFSYTYYDRQDRYISRSLLDSRFEYSTDYTVDEANQTVDFVVDIEDNGFIIPYKIILEDDHFRLSFDTTSIEEYEENKIASISFYEFLGAVYEDAVPGYNFIPSGNGALVRYKSTSEINAQYRADFLGRDLYYSSNPNNLELNYPVFGFVHGINQNGMFMHLDQGFENAVYNYAPVGVRTQYHRQYVEFRLRESYIQNIPGADSNPTILEEDIRTYTVDYDFYPLDGEAANYVGMAHKYKEILDENNVFSDVENPSIIGLHLDVLGSDYSEGLIFKNHHDMTTTTDLVSMHEHLNEAGIDDVFYTLRGFNEGGYLDFSYRNYDFNNRLGDLNDLEGLDYYHLYDPTIQLKNNNNAPRQALQQINNTYARINLYEGEYYQFFTEIDAVMDRFNRAMTDLDRVALDGLSYRFYSGEDTSRTALIDQYQNLLDIKIPMVNPNALMLENTGTYLNMPFQHERLRFFTDNVPFLPIVLSGEIPYYSEFLNFSSNRQIDILKAIDFKAYPAFLVTEAESYLLSETSSREFYGTHFDSLESQIIEDFNMVKQALTPVKDESIVMRDVLERGIVKVTYSNDISLYINYTSEAYTVEGVTIDALDYAIESQG